MALPPHIALLRPKQWVKNAFVFAPLVLSQSLTEPSAVLSALGAALVFCALASAIYIVNDWCDIKADRAHPEKRRRPLAAGTVTKPQAVGLLAGLLAIAAALMVLTGASTGFVIVTAIYVLQSVSYSFGLKHVPLLELFVVASGYVLRVIAGCFILDIEPSRWILLATGLVAMLITVGKRRADLTAAIEAEKFRKSLQAYSVSFLDQIMSVCAAMAIMSYVLFTISDYAVERFGKFYMFETSVFVAFGVFRYLQITAMPGAGGDPTTVVTRDKPLIICVLLWGIAVLAILYAL